MDSSRRETDQAFERKLRERFENFQAPEKVGLSENIFEFIGIKPRRRRWIAIVLMVFLLLLGFRAGIDFPEHADTRDRRSVLQKARPDNSNVAGDSISYKAFKKNPAKLVLSRPYKPHFADNVVSSILKTKKVEVTASAADSSVTATPSHGDFNFNLLSGRDLKFGQLTLPEIAFKDFTQTKEEQSESKSSPFIPVFSITGMQQFQIVNVHSDSEMPFQNVQFAPLLNVRSMSYKVGAGIEKGSLQLLLTYGNIRTWNYYEVGTDRIEISPTNGNQYIQRRGGIPQTIDEKVHLLALSARTMLPLGRTPLGGLSTMAGLEFTTVLPDPAVMLWANIRSLKSIHLRKRNVLAVGPYAEYSLSQRTFLGGRWQSRPYRIGLTIEIKFAER